MRRTLLRRPWVPAPPRWDQPAATSGLTSPPPASPSLARSPAWRSDADTNVQNAAAFLDRLVKDVVAESHAFDVAGFVGTLRETLGVADPLKRQFLLGWLRWAEPS